MKARRLERQRYSSRSALYRTNGATEVRITNGRTMVVSNPKHTERRSAFCLKRYALHPHLLCPLFSRQLTGRKRPLPRKTHLGKEPANRKKAFLPQAGGEKA
jgi:hypothetical protein